MGESPSARTQRELGELRSAIDRDVGALVARAREDADPRNLVRRNPLAVIGSVGAMASAAALAVVRRRRESSLMEGRIDEVVERLGGRIGKLRGGARKTFRKQLRREMDQVAKSSPREAARVAVTAAVTALATTVARGLGRRLLADETDREGEL